jgi:hypothetical protein
MAKQARSARGQVVDFDLLAIKQQLATQPVPVGVNQRRKFIDEKDGIKHRNQENYIVPPADVAQSSSPLPSALAVAAEAAATSAKAAEKPKAKKD